MCASQVWKEGERGEARSRRGPQWVHEDDASSWTDGEGGEDGKLKNWKSRFGRANGAWGILGCGVIAEECQVAPGNGKRVEAGGKEARDGRTASKHGYCCEGDKEAKQQVKSTDEERQNQATGEMEDRGVRGGLCVDRTLDRGPGPLLQPGRRGITFSQKC